MATTSGRRCMAAGSEAEVATRVQPAAASPASTSPSCKTGMMQADGPRRTSRTPIKTYAASVRIVEAARGNDAYDHLNLGGTVAESGFCESPVSRSHGVSINEYLSGVLDGTWVQPKPTVGSRTDGKGLFLPGQVTPNHRGD